MPVGLTQDLPYPMILGRDWRKIYEVLGVAKNVGTGEIGLTEEGTGELNLEQLTSSQESTGRRAGIPSYPGNGAGKGGG
ncbi:hypothetical protein Y1Q_0006732 [Alligator mississippiensis]|uniref:Uncharacterized protein n=1 Tax=Alligator mississippiensis TaxID=8496 RepID=A0A151NSU9_ALLMI|nr:hypothetical protein Y1Q_0006732 [Alligator mississippiensis]